MTFWIRSRKTDTIVYPKKRRKSSFAKDATERFYRGILHAFNLSLNIVFIILLILSGFSTQISPERFILPALLSLGFPFFVIVNILFVLLWIVRRRWHFALSLFCLILLSGNIQNCFPLHPLASNDNLQSDDSIRSIRVLSYNVKLFNFYDLQHGRNPMLEYIASQDVDIVCLQEFGFYNHKDFLSFDRILRTMQRNFPYHHISCRNHERHKSSYGIATFSKFPIIRQGRVNYPSAYSRTVFSDILVGNDTIRVFNCHLESNQLTIDDKKRMQELMDRKETGNLSQTTGQISGKLGKAAKIRARQSDSIHAAVRRSDVSHIILCGDFNDHPLSYNYKRIRGELNDAFVSTSSGFGITYNEFPFYYRIDHLLYSKNVKPDQFRIHRDAVKDGKNLSDHYPISCSFFLIPIKTQ
ncbi:MAG: endonuclease/exonuclease/phosphatase family protein [Paludibacteraceae bacterium]|nr:endonuclease/exonuclease/phosphatase family protein [Paludibacteraceae bacterium]